MTWPRQNKFLCWQKSLLTTIEYVWDSPTKTIETESRSENWTKMEVDVELETGES